MWWFCKRFYGEIDGFRRKGMERGRLRCKVDDLYNDLWEILLKWRCIIDERGGRVWIGEI